jgi:hypothetical protein
MIRDVLRGAPGELHHHRWDNFASNRNAALELARERADYIFVIDADDHLVCDGNPFVDLSEQCYWVEFEHGGTRYRRIQLFDQGLDCREVGALHEALVIDGSYSVDTLPNCHIRYGATGSRSRDPRKFLKDARLLETEVARNPRKLSKRLLPGTELQGRGDMAGGHGRGRRWAAGRRRCTAPCISRLTCASFWGCPGTALRRARVYDYALRLEYGSAATRSTSMPRHSA